MIDLPDTDNAEQTFHASVLTLYPEMFPGPLGISLAGKALAEGTWSLDTVQIRDFAEGKHRMVDDTPSGGGAGMVMKPDVVARALDSVGDDRPMLLMSPRGAPLTQNASANWRKVQVPSFFAVASRASTNG